MEKFISILIKESYAEGILQELSEKKAIEIVEKLADADNHEIPEWQKQETNSRMEVFRKNPTNVYTWEEVEKMLDEDEEI